MTRLICGHAILEEESVFSSSEELCASSVGRSSKEASGASPKRLCLEGYEPRLVPDVGVDELARADISAEEQPSAVQYSSLLTGEAGATASSLRAVLGAHSIRARRLIQFA